jgi:tetrahydromethanopterin S-methyltransferase subunit C
MENIESVPPVPSSRLLKSDIVTNILAFLGVLLLLLILSSTAIYFINVAIPSGNEKLTNTLISLIITGTLGSLIGVVTFVTITMTRQANEQITNEFSAAKALAVANQTEAKALAVANQTALETLMQNEFKVIRGELSRLNPESKSDL